MFIEIIDTADTYRALKPHEIRAEDSEKLSNQKGGKEYVCSCYRCYCFNVSVCF